MHALLVSDLHLTDRPADAYRWEVFNQVRDLSVKHGVTDLYILGDLTEFKDYHSSRLVNRLVEALYNMRKQSRIIDVHILKGNHDGLDPALPFFLFLRRVPWCHFYAVPTWMEAGADTVLWLPHTRDAEEDWKDLEMGNATHIFFHGAVHGAVSESGQKLDGISLDWFKGLHGTKVIGGDIHVPQVVGKCVEYVGAPYPIRFGDDFQPRAVLLQGKTLVTLPLDNIHKVTVSVSPSAPMAAKLRAGDQVKVLIELSDSQLGEFQRIKAEVKAAVESQGAVLSKVQLVRKAGKPKIGQARASTRSSTPLEELGTFCNRNSIAEDLREIGEELLRSET